MIFSSLFSALPVTEGIKIQEKICGMGKVNILRLTKGMAYGRAVFESLRQRVLHAL
jgi:hypothetical protein